MSISYTESGRTRQKARTRQSLIDAAGELLAEGVTPSVEETAARAGVSRATAYRYFDNHRLLISAAAPYTDVPSLLPPHPPLDPVERVTLVATEILRITIEAEAQLRAMLRVSLDPNLAEQDLPLRKGRRLRWFEDALSPLQDRLDEEEYRRLVLEVAAAVGIETLVWLTDIAGLSRRAAADLLIGTARALTRAALPP
jgi:AcrR family transcriptional regulator